MLNDDPSCAAWMYICLQLTHPSGLNARAQVSVECLHVPVSVYVLFVTTIFVSVACVLAWFTERNTTCVVGVVAPRQQLEYLTTGCARGIIKRRNIIK